MDCRLAPLATCASLLCATAPLAPVLAAVRICQPVVAVGPFEAPTELEARRMAIEAWVKEAGKHGRQFAGWSVAVNKELKCLPGDAGTIRCAARAEPCRIQQNPSKRPAPAGKPIDT